jgi:Spy/CpxP family protein refolding chaperone
MQSQSAMDFLTSKRFITATLVILVVLNVTLLGMLWWQNTHKPEHRSYRITRQYSKHVYFARPLALSEEQSLQFRQLRKEHFRKVMPDLQAIAALKKDLVSESVKEKPDTAKIAALAGSIGARQTVIEKEQALHFQKLAQVCTPGQRDSLRNILEHVAVRKLQIREERSKEHPGSMREFGPAGIGKDR